MTLKHRPWCQGSGKWNMEKASSFCPWALLPLSPRCLPILTFPWFFPLFTIAPAETKITLRPRINICEYLLVSKRLRDPSTIRTRVIITCSYYSRIHISSLSCVWLGSLFCFLIFWRHNILTLPLPEKLERTNLKDQRSEWAREWGAFSPVLCQGPSEKSGMGPAGSWGKSCDQTCVQFSHWSLWVEEIFV